MNGSKFPGQVNYTAPAETGMPSGATRPCFFRLVNRNLLSMRFCWGPMVLCIVLARDPRFFLCQGRAHKTMEMSEEKEG